MNDLSARCPEAMAEAMEPPVTRDSTVTVKFREVEPVELEEVEPGHVTACLLHTSRGRR
ncbi:MAG: hypothetical protein GWN73_09200 [Actinobacteria bacterium]|nr:hypothetical protein [Actinomycetota bacterium]NIS30356.1 hypothetical protein [Actinomycetota bacterium]NIU65585.1 hypothetical protein [Actinomycetota bacterium]NIW27393.1 hypothetical protein [Actinomycetota bacterium]